MSPSLRAAVLQATTPTGGVVPDELVEIWPPLVPAGWFVAGFLAVILLGWYVIEPAISRGIAHRNRGNPTIQEAISRYVRLATLVVAFFVGIGAAGFTKFLGGSALVIAAATLAVGVAGGTVIGSIVSGLALVIDPEFNVGNYIRWSDGEGEVVSITLRVTRIHTPDGGLVTIPNTTLTDETITRPYSRERRRVVEQVDLSYEDDIDEALGHLSTAAAEREGVLEDPTPQAYVDELGDDAVSVRVHYWIDDPRRRSIPSIRSAYARAAKDRLERAGITISPPTKRELEGRIGVDGSSRAPS